MESKKLQKFIDIIIKVLTFISSFLGAKGDKPQSVITDVKQDTHTNTELLKKISGKIKEEIK